MVRSLRVLHMATYMFGSVRGFSCRSYHFLGNKPKFMDALIGRNPPKCTGIPVLRVQNGAWKKHRPSSWNGTRVGPFFAAYSSPIERRTSHFTRKPIGSWSLVDFEVSFFQESLESSTWREMTTPTKIPETFESLAGPVFFKGSTSNRMKHFLASWKHPVWSWCQQSCSGNHSPQTATHRHNHGTGSCSTFSNDSTRSQAVSICPTSIASCALRWNKAVIWIP